MARALPSIHLGQRLKQRIASMQDEITQGVKQLSSQAGAALTGAAANISAVATAANASPEYKPSRFNLEAGCELLEHYKSEFAKLHLSGENNARLARDCDVRISKMHSAMEKRCNDAATLQMLIAQLPKVNEQIEEVMNSLGNLEASFGEVEIALLALEDTIDARELQERQLEQRFQLAMYEERKKTELNELHSQLRADYTKKKQEAEVQSLIANRMLQEHLQKRFEDDVSRYRTNRSLQVPVRHDPEASLETVDLDDDESALESFLRDDIIEDVSPLPKDPSLPDKLPSLLGVGAAMASVRISPAESGGSSLVSPSDVAGASRSESLYFTPDVTVERLSDLNP